MNWDKAVIICTLLTPAVQLCGAGALIGAGKWPWSIVWLGYAVLNVVLIIIERKGL